MAGYVAAFPLVVAHTGEGRQLYAYKGQPINEAVTPDEIKRLLADGSIVKAEDSEGEPPAKPAPKAAPKAAAKPAEPKPAE